MNVNDRARMIIDKVLAHDARLDPIDCDGPNSSVGATRWVSDDARWKAKLVPGQLNARLAGDDQPGAANWDLFQLFVYDQLRVTAHYRGEELAVRLYEPGVWEPIFLIITPPACDPIRPGS